MQVDGLEDPLDSLINQPSLLDESQAKNNVPEE